MQFRIYHQFDTLDSQPVFEVVVGENLTFTDFRKRKRPKVKNVTKLIIEYLEEKEQVSLTPIDKYVLNYYMDMKLCQLQREVREDEIYRRSLEDWLQEMKVFIEFCNAFNDGDPIVKQQLDDVINLLEKWLRQSKCRNWIVR